MFIRYDFGESINLTEFKKHIRHFASKEISYNAEIYFLDRSKIIILYKPFDYMFNIQIEPFVNKETFISIIESFNKRNPFKMFSNFAFTSSKFYGSTYYNKRSSKDKDLNNIIDELCIFCRICNKLIKADVFC